MAPKIKSRDNNSPTAKANTYCLKKFLLSFEWYEFSNPPKIAFTPLAIKKIETTKDVDNKPDCFCCLI